MKIAFISDYKKSLKNRSGEKNFISDMNLLKNSKII